jgi:hypothetical protein
MADDVVAEAVAEALEALARGLRAGAVAVTEFGIKVNEQTFASHLGMVFLPLDDDESEPEEPTAKHAAVVMLRPDPRVCPHCQSTTTTDAGRTAAGEDEHLCIDCNRTWTTPSRVAGG